MDKKITNKINQGRELLKHDFFNKFFKYFLVGLLGIVVDNIVTFCTYNFVLISIFNPSNSVTFHILQTISAICGSIAGMFHNFVISDIFIFKSKQINKTRSSFFKRLSKFYITGLLGGFLISKIIVFNIALYVCHNQIISNMIGIAIGMLFNYPINYYWTWKSNHLSRNETN